MKTKSIKELFAALEADRGGAKRAQGTENAKPTAAERVGRALLDRLGGQTGLTEDELAEAIIAVWDDPKSLGMGEEEAKKPYSEPEMSVERFGEEPELMTADAPRPPFGERKRTPVPLRSGGMQAAPVDYDELTREQFLRLKKQLKKAAAEGKRVRL